jgi:large subunit ribosomal protein L1
MAKLSKRVKAFRERVDANKSYPLDEAIAILKETATAKFNESVEVAVNLGIDARKPDLKCELPFSPRVKMQTRRKKPALI